MGTTASRPVQPVAYNTEDAAIYLGASADTLRYWRRVGYGPPSFKMGRNVMYLRTDLDAWIELLRAGVA